MERSDPPPVFYDPKGSRRKGLSRFALGLSLVASVVLSGFTLSILAVPALPHVNLGPPALRAFFPKPHPAQKNPRWRERQALMARIARPPAKPKPTARRGSHVVLGFYTPWQETSLTSFRSVARSLTHVSPAWLRLDQGGLGLDTRDYDPASNPRTRDVLKIARSQGVRVVPVLSNSTGAGFDSARVGRLIDSPKRQAFCQSVASWLKEKKLHGLSIDFEDLSDSVQDRLPGFLSVLHQELAKKDLELSVCIESRLDGKQMSGLAEYADWVVLMAYDENDDRGRPGPIASVDWVDKTLQKALEWIPNDKMVLGFGSYAYDWPLNGGRADPLTYDEAMSTAAGYREEDKPEEVIDFDEDSLNPSFEYTDGDGDPHKVWFVDAASIYTQWMGARDMGLRGWAVWALGSEDPTVWSFLGRSARPGREAPAALEKMPPPLGVSEIGRGEVLKVESKPKEGSRSLEVDPESGAIVDENYHSYPLPYLIRRSGYKADRLVLTFDDGPDPVFTPLVLDELKKLGVKAAFFVVGQNAEAHPDLVRRILAEGHEIGSHTFTHPNLGAVSPMRTQLELNATQRAIQGITGRSTILFRPPFNADSEPGSSEEVNPIAIASRLGYVTVGEKIDPEDWDLNVRLPQGGSRPKTADDIVKDVLAQVKEYNEPDAKGANMILLHDAGGDRTATVAALGPLVRKLRSEGYQFASLSGLLGVKPGKLMPGLPASEKMQILLTQFVFGAGFTGAWLLALSFMTAIALGVARILFIMPLAWLNRRRVRGIAPDPSYRPSVSVLIAAYNEENVIAATIHSVLQSDYPLQEVIVVDDGSRDGTSEAVTREFAGDPRVRLITKANGGKASALTIAIQEASGEIVLCLDADTQLDPKALGHLTGWFKDPKVAAVAGNVKVGNQDGILTQWQAVEYTTSQNIDREAYARLNAVSVVPGAIGAWRREAVLRVGGYVSDTLAEDMDLTWRLRIAGYSLETESRALAYTEAPDSLSAFFKQRFRWAYGTLQCLWKHRRALGRHGWFGRAMMPTQWLFQVVFQCLAPLVDLQLLVSIGSLAMAWNAARAGTENEVLAYQAAIQNLQLAGFLYALFFALELAAGLAAFRWEKESPKPLMWLFLQRLVYRQIMYGVVLKSIQRALAGGRQSWGKLKRTGSVALPRAQ